VLLGNGNGTFGTKIQVGLSTYLDLAGIADMNADGRPDLVVANELGGTVSVLLGNGDGTFGIRTDLSIGGNPIAVAIADLNADGRPDLAVTSYNAGTDMVSKISVLLGSGDGSFGARTDFGSGSNPVSVAIADLNADGRPDLVVANRGGDWTGNTVSVLLGNGDGTFGNRTDFGTGVGPSSVASADLNADGRPDVVVANGGSYREAGSTISVLLGNGDGTLGARTDYGAGLGPQLAAIADINADGRPDLVVLSDTSSVLLGNGDGTFGARTDFRAQGASVAIADFDADGRLDLAVANGTEDNVSVLRGIGDGAFGAKADFGVGSYATSVATADLNLDGRPDLVVADYYSGAVWVLLNAGAGLTGIVPPPRVPPLAFGLLAPRPNPSLGTSEIRFLLPSDRPVQVDLFDVNGRRVWSWASRVSLSPGPHTVIWNGRDGSGAAARSGIYFLKVRAGHDQGVNKLVLQR
jgi:hypothetical protein